MKRFPLVMLAFSPAKMLTRLAAVSLAAITATTLAAPASANPRSSAQHTVMTMQYRPNFVLGAGFIGSLKETTIGSSQDLQNGDQNPYGLAIAPATSGKLTKGDLVICNFNDGIGGLNIQSLGSTIEALHPAVGSTPRRIAIDPRATGCGSLDFNSSGQITVASYTADDIALFDTNGNEVATRIAPNFAAPWGGIHGNGMYFVSNALSGSITRISGNPPNQNFQTLVASITPNHGVPGAILAPSGLTYDPKLDRLYIVDGNGNRVLYINHVSSVNPSQVVVNVLFSGAPLNGPVSAVQLYNGDLLVGNTGDNNMIELSTTTAQTVVGKQLVDSGAVGAIFGIVATGTSASTEQIYFNDDNSNTLVRLSQH